MSTKVVVRHFHEGNDADKAIRKHAVYATHARIVDLDTGLTVEGLRPEPDYNPGSKRDKSLEPVMGAGWIEAPVEVWAFCNSKDVPSRKQGRSIALGRLQKLFPEECAKADFGVFKNLKVK